MPPLLNTLPLHWPRNRETETPKCLSSKLLFTSLFMTSLALL